MTTIIEFQFRKKKKTTLESLKEKKKQLLVGKINGGSEEIKVKKRDLEWVRSMDKLSETERGKESEERGYHGWIMGEREISEGVVKLLEIECGRKER